MIYKNQNQDLHNKHLIMGGSLTLTPILDQLFSVIIYPDPGLGSAWQESSFLFHSESLSGPLIHPKGWWNSWLLKPRPVWSQGPPAVKAGLCWSCDFPWSLPFSPGRKKKPQPSVTSPGKNFIHSGYCSCEAKPWVSCHFLAHGAFIFAFHRPATGPEETRPGGVGAYPATWDLGPSAHRLSFLLSFKARGLDALPRSRVTDCLGLPGMGAGVGITGCRASSAKIRKAPENRDRLITLPNATEVSKTLLSDLHAMILFHVTCLWRLACEREGSRTDFLKSPTSWAGE